MQKKINKRTIADYVFTLVVYLSIAILGIIAINFIN